MTRAVEMGLRRLAVLIASSLIGWGCQAEGQPPERDGGTEASVPVGDGAAEADAFAFDVGSPPEAEGDALMGNDASSEDAGDATLDTAADAGDAAAPDGGAGSTDGGDEAADAGVEPVDAATGTDPTVDRPPGRH